MDKAINMVSPVIFGIFVGQYLDQVFHTKPFIMLGLTLLGVATGIWSVIKSAYYPPPPPDS